MSKRFIGFARVSSVRQRQEGYSNEVQKEKITAWVKKQGGELVKVWDVAESASAQLADGYFDEMLSFAANKSNKINGIVFDRVDRATRSPIRLGQILMFAEKHDVHFYFISENSSTADGAGVFLFMIHGAVAYQSVNQLKKKIVDAQWKRVMDGFFHSLAPYGYENYRQGMKPQIRTVQHEAEAIKFIFSHYAWKGYTLDRLVQELNQRGFIWSEKRPKFLRSTVHRMLSNRSYIGEISFNGQWYPGGHEPLIDRTTFDRVQALSGKPKYEHHSHLFGTGMLHCGQCAHPVTGYEVRKNKGQPNEKVYCYYFCGTCRDAGRPRKQVSETTLSNQVLDLFLRLKTDDPEVRAWFVDALALKAKESEQTRIDEVHRLDRGIAGVIAKEAKLLQLFYADQINTDDFGAEKTRLRDERAKLEERRAHANRQGDEASDDAVRAFQLANSLENRWKTADSTDRRALLNVLASNWTLEGVSLVPTMRKPFDVLLEGPLIQSGRTDRI